MSDDLDSALLMPLLIAQVNACDDWPHMAPIFRRMKFRIEDAVPTIGTSETLTVLVGRGWLEKLIAKWGTRRRQLVQELIEVLKHEALHVFLGYWERQEGRPGLPWNVAHDLEIAQYVQPPECLKPGQFKLPNGKSAEWYYPRLPQGQGQPQGCSQHRVEREPPGADRDEAQSEARRGVLETAREVLTVRSVPGQESALERRALEVLGLGRRNEMLARIQGSLTTCGADDYSYSRPSRRQSAVGSTFVLPAMVHRQPRVAVVLDVSGSMNDKVRPATRVVLDIVRSIGAAVDVVAWDTQPIARANVRSAQDIARLKHSGGGTDMGAALEWCLLHMKRDLTLVVTDGETEWCPERTVRRLGKVMCVLVGEAPGYMLPDYIEALTLEAV